MKKLITIVSVLLICVTAICAFVACKEQEPDLTGLNAAKEYLETMLKDAATVTGADYTRPAVLKNEHGTYTVTWTLSVTSGPAANVTLGEAVNGLVTINVDEFASAETAYTLTAVISDAEGNALDAITYTHKVPKFVVNTYEEYIAACNANDGETIITIKGYVVGINADSGSSSKGSIWLVDENGKGYYAYKPTLAAEITASREAMNAAFPRGKEIVVKGTVTKYGGCYEFNSKCEIISTGNSVDPATLAYVDQTELFGSAANMNDEATLAATQSTRVALNNVTMGRIDGYNYYFKVNEKEFICYMNIYLLSQEENTALAAKWAPGSTANLTGVINVYSSKYQIYPDSVDSIVVTSEPLTNEQKVALAAEYANYEFALVTEAGEVELSTTAQGYSDVTVSWAIKAGESYNFASIVDNALVIANLPEAETNVKLTATFTCGTATATADFEVAVSAAPVENPSSVSITAPKLGLGNYAAGDAVVSGYDFSFTELGDYGNGIQCRNKDGKKSTLFNTEAFWTGIYQIDITLNGEKSIYDNADAFSFTFGTAANALNSEVKFSTVKDQREYTITPDAQTYTYFKMEILLTYSFYFDEIKIWFVDPSTAPKTDDDKIAEEKDALSLAVKEYTENGTATLPVVGATYPEVAIAWSSEATELAIDGANLTVTVPADNKIVTLTATITCGTGTAVTKEFAILMNVKVVTTIAEALEAPVGVTATLSGTVTEIKEAWSSYNNMSFNITDGTSTIYIYRCKTQVNVGDVITVTGKVGYYNTNQIAQGSTAEITSAHTHSYGDATCTEPATCSCGATEGNALGHTDVNPADGICDRCTESAAAMTFAKATAITVGDVVVLVYEAGSMEGSVQSGNTNFVTSEAYEGTPAGLRELTIVAGANTDTFAFQTSEGKYLASNDGNNLILADSVTEASSWTVVFEEGNAIITNVSTGRIIRYNTNNPRFAAYTSTSSVNTPIQLYKEVPVEA